MIPFAHPLPGTRSVQSYHPDGMRTVTFQHGTITVKITYNEPSADAIEHFRTDLYGLLCQIIDSHPAPAQPTHSETSSAIDPT